jgi:hypothetical protein
VRLLLGLAAVLVLAGCGAGTGGPGAPGGQSAPAVPVQPAPPIVPLDEAPPAEVTRMLDEELAPLPADFGKQGAAGSSSVTFLWAVGTQGPGGPTSTSTPTPAQIAEARRQFDAHREKLEPAPGSSPRAVARLPLADGGDTLFIAWHNRDGLLCTYTNTADAGGGGGGGAAGPCEGDQQGTQCADVCLASSGTGTNTSAERWVLTGTVPADADALDVTTADGATAEYPLTGPVLDGDRRVFLLELGAHDWRKLGLVRGGQVVDETTMPAAEAAGEDCNEKVGPMPMPPTISATGAPVEQTGAMKAYDAAFQACLAASGAFPGLPVVPPLGSTP